MKKLTHTEDIIKKNGNLIQYFLVVVRHQFYIEKILIQLDDVFDISNVKEITLEANPGEASFNFLNDIKKIGINRLSIGFQSFNDEVLKKLGRYHRSNDCFKTFKNARKAGFKNINTDMIFNIPNLSTNQWIGDIKKLISIEPEHISAYSLTVEPSTKLFNLVKNNKMLMPSEQIDIEQFLITKDILMKNKYFQYEISNYSKKNMECKHNLNYWESNPYISFGPSAHSYDTKKRWWNVKSLDKYLSLVGNRKLPVENFEILKKQDKYNEMILNGLRFTKGISLNKIKKFHKNHLIYLKDLTKKWDCIDLSNGYLKLNKNGMLLVDNISSDMFI